MSRGSIIARASLGMLPSVRGDIGQHGENVLGFLGLMLPHGWGGIGQHGRKALTMMLPQIHLWWMGRHRQWGGRRRNIFGRGAVASDGRTTIAAGRLERCHPR